MGTWLSWQETTSTHFRKILLKQPFLTYPLLHSPTLDYDISEQQEPGVLGPPQ